MWITLQGGYGDWYGSMGCTSGPGDVWGGCWGVGFGNVIVCGSGEEERRMEHGLLTVRFDSLSYPIPSQSSPPD